jgi:hypothetical protein
MAQIARFRSAATMTETAPYRLPSIQTCTVYANHVTSHS